MENFSPGGSHKKSRGRAVQKMGEVHRIVPYSLQNLDDRDFIEKKKSFILETKKKTMTGKSLGGCEKPGPDKPLF